MPLSHKTRIEELRPRGRLRMHTGTGFGTHQMVRELPRFLERHPDVHVDLIIEERGVDMVRENIDISVRPWAPNTGSLVARKLFEFERVVCASPAYLRRHGTPRSPEDWPGIAAWGFRPFPTLGQWPFRTPSGSRVIEVPVAASTNSKDLIYRFALAGLGLVRQNEFIVAEAVRDGSLIRLLKDYRCPEHLAMLAIYPQERHRLPHVAAMLDFLVQTFGSRPWVASASRASRKR